MTQRLMMVLVILLLSCELCSAATIYGNIYDPNFNQFRDRVEIEVNSSPRQYRVSTDGTYSFFLLVGEYAIKARYEKGGAVRYISEENIVVNDEGRFVHDIVLYPTSEEEERLLNHTAEVPVTKIPIQQYLPLFVVIGLIFIIAITIIIIVLRSKQKRPARETRELAEAQGAQEQGSPPPDEEQPGIPADLEGVTAFLKENQGRATQKEIRKHIPLSEAKISLMITELEDRGVVRKIKKGRSNVIVLIEQAGNEAAQQPNTEKPVQEEGMPERASEDEHENPDFESEEL